MSVVLAPAPRKYSRQDQDQLRRALMLLFAEIDARLTALENA